LDHLRQLNLDTSDWVTTPVRRLISGYAAFHDVEQKQ
jgi:hypothetical protein